MPIVISAINGKGGAGKSTIIMNVAGEYALRGSAVAIVDMDPRSNLTQWWSDCRQKDAQADGIEVFGHKTARAVGSFLDRAAGRFEYILIDTPGEDTAIVDPVIGWSNLVLSPIQASKREVLGAIDCFESVQRVNHALRRSCRHGVLRTRVSLTVRHTELYRKVRPIIEDKVGSYLFQTEVMERNVYKDIQNGTGTLQMQDLTEAVAKARRETKGVVEEIDTLLNLGCQTGITS
jgi:chromosome partitioning protein